MDHDLPVADGHVRVIGRLMRSGNVVRRFEIERHLMRQRALDVKRNAAPDTRDRPVQMAHA